MLLFKEWALTCTDLGFMTHTHTHTHTYTHTHTHTHVHTHTGVVFEKRLFYMTFATKDRQIGMDAFVAKKKAEFVDE